MSAGGAADSDEANAAGNRADGDAARARRPRFFYPARGACFSRAPPAVRARARAVHRCGATLAPPRTSRLGSSETTHPLIATCASSPPPPRAQRRPSPNRATQCARLAPRRPKSVSPPIAARAQARTVTPQAERSRGESPRRTPRRSRLRVSAPHHRDNGCLGRLAAAPRGPADAQQGRGASVAQPAWVPAAVAARPLQALLALGHRRLERGVGGVRRCPAAALERLDQLAVRELQAAGRRDARVRCRSGRAAGAAARSSQPRRRHCSHAPRGPSHPRPALKPRGLLLRERGPHRERRADVEPLAPRRGPRGRPASVRLSARAALHASSSHPALRAPLSNASASRVQAHMQ